MSRIFGVFGFAFAVFAVAGFAGAGTVELIIDYSLGGTDGDSSTFDILLQTSTGDNDGIAGYNVTVEGASSLDHFQIGQGVTVVDPPIYSKGFLIFNSDNDVLFAGQNSTNVDSLLYGVGNEDFMTPAPGAGLSNLNMPAVDSPFSPIKIASGVSSTANGNVVTAANVNLWDSGQSGSNGTSASAADMVTIRVVEAGPVIPEPSTVMLVCLTAVGLVASRRRAA